MTASRETRGKAKQEKVHDGVEMDVDEKPGDGAAVEDVVERFEEFVDELKEHCSLEDLKAIAEENAITPDLPPRMLLLGL
jgi:hypothetical protein